MRRSLVALSLLVAVGCDNSSTTATAEPADAAAKAAAQAAADGAKAPADATPTPDAVVADAAPTAAAKTGDDLCSRAGFTLDKSTVVATVGGEPIRAAELGPDSLDAERDALHRYCREAHRIRQTATQRAVEDHLMATAARTEGIAVDAFIRGRLDAAVKRPDDAEIAAFYEANKTEQAPPLDQVKGQVEEAIVKERTRVAYDELITSLRKDAKVVVSLPDLRPPAFSLPTEKHTATFGPDDAKVKIVEFSDFECPYCARAATAVGTLKSRFGDSVQVSYRHFPLSFHPGAQPAAEISQCAHEQGKFWEMHDEIFANSRGLNPDALRGMAEKVGLDLAALDECMASGRARTQVEADMTKAREVGVQGTPAFYLDGRPFEGGADELAAAVETALAGS